MNRKLLALSAVEGAAVMAAELCGAKLMAPVYGSSLYVWASVMGITLAALAGGYFFGGLLSQKPQPARWLFRVLIGASVFLLAMPLFSYYILPRVSYLPFLPAIVISSSLLLLPPVFFLGATSPLFISLQSVTGNSGQVSGTVYAVSTAGGIGATFLCGFWLIPGIGLTRCLLLFGLLLLAGTLLVFRRFSGASLLPIALLVYLNTQSKTGQQTLYSSDSLMGHLDVEEFAAPVNRRHLVVNGIIQTEMDGDSHRSVSRYVSLLDTLIPPAAREKKSLVLGLGGGLTANLLIQKGYSCTGVDLDPRIISSAKRFFFLDPRVTTRVADARDFMNRCRERFDLVLVDVFKAEEQPSHVLTRESLEQLKLRLTDSALLYINWHGYLAGKRGQGTAVLYNTLVAAGYQVQVFGAGSTEGTRNLVFKAALQPLPACSGTIAYLAPPSVINTDDQPVLESYNARANMAWRVNYLRYYQSAGTSSSGAQ